MKLSLENTTEIIKKGIDKYLFIYYNNNVKRGKENEEQHPQENDLRR